MAMPLVLLAEATNAAGWAVMVECRARAVCTTPARPLIAAIVGQDRDRFPGARDLDVEVLLIDEIGGTADGLFRGGRRAIASHGDEGCLLWSTDYVSKAIGALRREHFLGLSAVIVAMEAIELTGFIVPGGAILLRHPGSLMIVQLPQTNLLLAKPPFTIINSFSCYLAIIKPDRSPTIRRRRICQFNIIWAVFLHLISIWERFFR
jgi:hypothetical protein